MRFTFELRRPARRSVVLAVGALLLDRLEVFLGTRNTGTNATSFDVSGASSLSAMTFSFGRAGTDEL
jgi:hypothetical protein